MKQSIYAIGILVLFVSAKAIAQSSETAFITRADGISPLLSRSADIPTVPKKLNVPVITTENFKKDFKNVQDVEWIRIANRFRAYFYRGTILTAVDYTRKGRLYSIIRYGKAVLPNEVIQKIETTFDSPVIVEASEVKISEFATTVYIVVLEDKTSMKSIQIIDGQIEVISEMGK